MAPEYGHPALCRTTIEHALRLAPDRCPDPSWSDREIWMEAGARRFAEKLAAIYQNQQDENVQT